MFNDFFQYFIIGFLLTVGGLCGVAFMAMMYNIMDSVRLKLKRDNND